MSAFRDDAESLQAQLDELDEEYAALVADRERARAAQPHPVRDTFEDLIIDGRIIPWLILALIAGSLTGAFGYASLPSMPIYSMSARATSAR